MDERHAQTVIFQLTCGHETEDYAFLTDVGLAFCHECDRRQEIEPVTREEANVWPAREFTAWDLR